MVNDHLDLDNDHLDGITTTTSVNTGLSKRLGRAELYNRIQTIWENIIVVIVYILNRIKKKANKVYKHMFF